MRLIKRVFWTVVLLAIAVFAAANLGKEATVILDPLGYTPDRLAQTLSVCEVTLISLAIGLVIGVVLEHDRARAVRRDLRAKQDEVTRLRLEVGRLRDSLKESDHPDSVTSLKIAGGRSLTLPAREGA